MPETEPQQGKHNFIRRTGERIGIIETTNKRQARNQAFTDELEASIKETLNKAHMYANHTDACLSKIEFDLGITNRDPHPNHPISFTECHHQN